MADSQAQPTKAQQRAAANEQLQEALRDIPRHDAEFKANQSEKK
jgi:hypothetical protein